MSTNFIYHAVILASCTSAYLYAVSFLGLYSHTVFFTYSLLFLFFVPRYLFYAMYLISYISLHSCYTLLNDFSYAIVYLCLSHHFIVLIYFYSLRIFIPYSFVHYLYPCQLLRNHFAGLTISKYPSIIFIQLFHLTHHTESSFNIFLSANIVAYYHSSIIIQ